MTNNHKEHSYSVSVQWTGNLGQGTANYRTYARDHEISALSGIVVTDYQDEAKGIMVETEAGGGHFTRVTLRPAVKVSSISNTDLALQLHEKAHHLCFIASSVNFPVLCEPSIEVE